MQHRNGLLSKFAVAIEKGKPTEDICKKCPLVATKPGNEPKGFVPVIQYAIELVSIREAGLLDIFELDCLAVDCLKAYTKGRNAAENIRMKRQKAEAEKNNARAD
jgi:hypothetical protein